MKLLRYGPVGQEKPGTLDAEMRRVDAIPEAVQRRRPA